MCATIMFAVGAEVKGSKTRQTKPKRSHETGEEEFENDKAFRKKFKKSRQDSINLLAGGRSRIRGHGDEVEEAEELMFDIQEKGKWYPLADYKEEFGDPVKNKAEVVTVKRRGVAQRGVFVEEDENAKGPVAVVVTSRQRASRVSHKHDGQVVSDSEMSGAVEEARNSVLAKTKQKL